MAGEPAAPPMAELSARPVLAILVGGPAVPPPVQLAARPVLAVVSISAWGAS
jgi:hypothetical protein